MKGETLGSKLRCLQYSLRAVFVFAFLIGLLEARSLNAQNAGERPNEVRKNSFGIIAAYSPDSSHILLGIAEKRKLWDFGGSYGRLLWSRPMADWRYEAEVLPLTLEGDPRSRYLNQQTSPTATTTILDGPPPIYCAPMTQSYDFKDPKGVRYRGVFHLFCHDRQWTVGQGMSPLGLRWNLLPRRKLQPTFVAHVGYMYSTRPVPVPFAGSFNFAFDFGPGIELYRSRTLSLMLEYRYHHTSNHNSAMENPGIDNGLFQVSYVFHR